MKEKRKLFLKGAEGFFCDKCGKVICYIFGSHAGMYHEGIFCPKCFEGEKD